MGGYGSGRWSWHSKKVTVEQCVVVDVAALTQAIPRLLQGHADGGEAVRLLYGGWRGPLRIVLRRGVRVPLVAYLSLRERNATGTVYLHATACHFGGRRWWFRCRFAPVECESCTCPQMA